MPLQHIPSIDAINIPQQLTMIHLIQINFSNRQIVLLQSFVTYFLRIDPKQRKQLKEIEKRKKIFYLAKFFSYFGGNFFALSGSRLGFYGRRFTGHWLLVTVHRSPTALEQLLVGHNFCSFELINVDRIFSRYTSPTRQEPRRAWPAPRIFQGPPSTYGWRPSLWTRSLFPSIRHRPPSAP